MADRAITLSEREVDWHRRAWNLIAEMEGHAWRDNADVHQRDYVMLTRCAAEALSRAVEEHIPDLTQPRTSGGAS